LIIVLYIVILFSRDSCEFVSISQLIFLILGSRCLLLASICVDHVRFLSRWSPKYLTSCVIGMGELLMLTCGQMAFLVVNVMCADFAGLTVITFILLDSFLFPYYNILNCRTVFWLRKKSTTLTNFACSKEARHVHTYPAFLCSLCWHRPFNGFTPAKDFWLTKCNTNVYAAIQNGNRITNAGGIL
jgi:hypothetical protein